MKKSELIASKCARMHKMRIEIKTFSDLPILVEGEGPPSVFVPRAPKFLKTALVLANDA